MNKISIIILCAGAGTRMKSSLPKVLHNISGKPMVYYSILEAKKISSDIHIVLYHQHELVKSTICKYFDDITFHIQDHENFPGTGGAVMNIDVKYDKTLVLNGDMPLIQEKELLSLTSNNEMVTMSIFDLDDASGYGRAVIKDNLIQKIVEQKDCNDEELQIQTANAGIYCFDTKFLQKNLSKLSNDNANKEYYITDLIEIAINDGKKVVPVVVNQENFKGVNSKYDLSNALTIHQNRIKKEFMTNGVEMMLHETIYIDFDVQIDNTSKIEQNVTLLGNTSIKNSTIKANSTVENSEIISSSVGPQARIRPNSKLEDTHIGNFVEVKNSQLKSVKAGHLSYLGDSTIGENTNIGAGTITCNYDGVNKYKTIIGKNVFIGSASQLIAPINIADDTMIAAGSTITHDISCGDLAISRTKQKIIKGFFYRFFKK